MIKKSILICACLISTQFIFANNRPIHIENDLFDVSSNVEFHKKFNQPCQFFVRSKIGGSTRTITFEITSEGAIDQLFLNGPILSIQSTEIFADRWDYDFQSYDLNTGKIIPKNFGKDGIWNIAISHDETMIVYTDFRGRYRTSKEMDSIHLISLSEKGPIDVLLSKNFYLKSNILWRYDDKSIVFIARSPKIKNPSDRYQDLLIVKIDISKGLNNIVESVNPVNQKSSLNANPEAMTPFMKYCQQVEDEMDNLEISWYGSGAVELKCPGISVQIP